jgi:hypothetical protein
MPFTTPPHPEERVGAAEARLEGRTAVLQLGAEEQWAPFSIFCFVPMARITSVSRERAWKSVFTSTRFGSFDGYTARRRPVSLVFHQHFERIEDAIAAERQVKGWRREKKEALIRGEYTLLPFLARRRPKAELGKTRREA